MDPLDFDRSVFWAVLRELLPRIISIMLVFGVIALSL